VQKTAGIGVPLVDAQPDHRRVARGLIQRADEVKVTLGLA